jgi:hypothetical protein
MRVLLVFALLLLATLCGACQDGPRSTSTPVTQPVEPSPTADGSVAAISPTPSAATPIPPVSASPPSPAPDPRPHHVSFAPANVPVAAHGVYVIDPHSGAIEGWVAGPAPTDVPPYPMPHAVSPRGRYIVLVHRDAKPGNTTERWYLFDTRRNSSRDLPSEPGPFSPDETRYVERTPDGIALVRTDAGVVEQTFSLGELRGSFFTFLPLWSPDGASLIVPFRTGWNGPDPLYRTYRLDARTGAVHALGDDSFYAVWYPHGRRYALFPGRGDRLQVFDATTGTVIWSITPEALNRDRRFAPDSVHLDVPAIARDGSAISLYVRGQDATSGESLQRLTVLDAATGALRFHVEGADCENRWTADGRWLLVGGLKDDLYTGYLVARDGSELRHFPHIIHIRLSPVDPDLAVQTAPPSGPPRLRVLDLPSGAERLNVEMTAPPGVGMGSRYAWLADGRLAVVVAGPFQGHCHVFTQTPSVTIRFP